MERRSFFQGQLRPGCGIGGWVSGQALRRSDKNFIHRLVPGLTTDALPTSPCSGAEAAAQGRWGRLLVFQCAPDFSIRVTPVAGLDAVIAKKPDAILIAPTTGRS